MLAFTVDRKKNRYGLLARASERPLMTSDVAATSVRGAVYFGAAAVGTKRPTPLVDALHEIVSDILARREMLA